MSGPYYLKNSFNRISATRKPVDQLSEDVNETFRLAVETYSHLARHNETLSARGWITRIQKSYEDSPRNRAIIDAIKAAMLDELDAFTSAYILAALWSSTVETEDKESPNYDKSFLDAGYSVDDLGTGELDAIIADCAAFRAAAGGMLAQWDAEQAGYDFWMTRCGHGTGFWDRADALPFRQELTALVGHGTAFTNRHLYVGDDGKVYGFAQ